MYSTKWLSLSLVGSYSDGPNAWTFHFRQYPDLDRKGQEILKSRRCPGERAAEIAHIEPSACLDGYPTRQRIRGSIKADLSRLLFRPPLLAQ